MRGRVVGEGACVAYGSMSGRYASYWNVFLSTKLVPFLHGFSQIVLHILDDVPKAIEQIASVGVTELLDGEDKTAESMTYPTLTR